MIRFIRKIITSLLLFLIYITTVPMVFISLLISYPLLGFGDTLYLFTETIRSVRDRLDNEGILVHYNTSIKFNIAGAKLYKALVLVLYFPVYILTVLAVFTTHKLNVR
jgi:hypothetical protein